MTPGRSKNSRPGLCRFQNRCTRVGILVSFSTLALTVSCIRDPSVTKRKYIQAGNKYFATGKYRQASILYRSALRQDAKFGEAYYRWGLCELQLNDLSEAVSPLRRAVELLPAGDEKLDAKSRLANLYLYYLEGVPKDTDIYAETQKLAADLVQSGTGAYDGHRLNGRLAMLEVQYATRRGIPDRVKQYLKVSIEEFRQANAIRPFESDVMVPLARSLMSDDQPKETEKIYFALLDHYKTFIPVYGELYNLYVREHRMADAETILKRGIENNPKELLFLTNLASHYQTLNRTDDALKIVERMKIVGKGSPHLHQVLGSFYMKCGHSDEAIRQYEAGIQDEPTEKNYYRKRLAEALIKLRKNSDADRTIESVLKEDPKDSEARLLRGSNYLQMGDIGSAIPELQTAARAEMGNPIARYMLGSALAEQGQTALSLPEFRKAIQLDPNYIEPRLKLAQVQILLDQNEGALKTAEDILADLDAQNVQAKLLRAIALRNLGRLDEARAETQGVLKRHPTSSDALLQFGELRLAEKNYKEAELAFRKSYEQNPADTRGLLRLCDMYIARNDSARAIEILRDESKKHPDRWDLHRAIADMAARAHDKKLAIAEYKAILDKLDPKTKAAAEVLGDLGETYREGGQYQLAFDTLSKAKEILPKDPAILSNLSITLLQLGRMAEAKQLYESTFSLQSDNPVALNNLAYLIAEKDGDLDMALTLAQRARQKWPHLYEISDTVGWIYLKKNLNDNAIEILQDIVDKNPDQPTFRYHLGAAWLQKGDKARARSELQTALSHHPTQEESEKIRTLLAKASR